MLYGWAEVVMIVRFECGCVGLVGVQGVEEGKHLLISACDADSSAELGLWPRNMDGKSHEPVSDEKARELVTEMSRLMMDGHRFREVKALLA